MVRMQIAAVFALTFGTLMWCSLARRIKMHSDITEMASEMGTCGEPKMIGVCKCDKWSLKHFSHQCSECIDKTKWGYGCKLNCPGECPDSCDFSGNCPPKNPCPDNCKRNSRVDDRTEETLCVNTNGLCQACDDGWYGKMCTEKCPTGCKEGVEGACMRDGTCYSCQEPFFGPKCDKQCPEACPKCTMEEGPDSSGDVVPAGSCLEACRGDKYGRECQQDCPANCERTGIGSGKSSCARNDGRCKKCAVGFHGPQCKEACESGCLGNECGQDDGVCVQGCKPGRWGQKCDKECPKFTVAEQGCDRADGFPESCDAKHYPFRGEAETPKCEVCPAGCQDGECDDKGRCTKDCVTGKHGKMCSKDCPDGCAEASGCSRDAGQCSKCKPGLTGLKCSKSCHSQCATCKQSNAGFLGAVDAGAGPGDCLTCPGDDASELSDSEDATCQCIAGAKREDASSKCMCEQPTDPLWEVRFETNPKKCAHHCKENYNGEALRPASGKGTTKCIRQSIYNACTLMWSKFYTETIEKGGEDCGPAEYKIVSEDNFECLHGDFVKYIVGEGAFLWKGV